jgi:hypothetical protein
LSNKKILTIILICTAIAFSAGIAYAEEPPNLPVMLYGNVMIDGNPAPIGTIITAKAGTDPAGATNVLYAGTYGEKANDRLPVSANDGANIDFYINGIKATSSVTFVYDSNDAGKLIRVDLKAISETSGTTVPSGGSGSGGSGGVASVTGGTPKTTAIQQPVTTTKESLTGTPATGTPVTTPGSKFPMFGWSSILGVFGFLALGAITIIALKKMGKI